MKLFVDLENQLITATPFVSSPVTDLEVPRAAAAPVEVRFFRGNSFVDPEQHVASIGASTVATNPVFTSPGHGFQAEDEVFIKDHAGLPIPIASSSPGAIVTMTSAATCVVTAASGTFATGDVVYFSTTGALPTNVVAGTAYYVTLVSATTFNISASLGGTPIDSSTGTQAGIHSIHNTRASTVTAPAHGLTSGGNGLGEDYVALSAGRYRVTIKGHPTTSELSGFINACTAANPAVVTTTAAHGLSTGDLVTISGMATAAAAVNGTRVVTVTSSTSFSVPVLGATSATGSFKRAASDINGTHIATYTGANTFVIPVVNTAIRIGGTATCTTTTPLIYGNKTIASVTEDTFTIDSLSVTAAGSGGTATKTESLALRWTVKADNQFDQNPAAASIAPGGFLKTGTGSSAVFKGSCNYITTALNTLLGISSDVSCTIAITSGQVTSAAHGLSIGDQIIFDEASSGDLPPEIAESVTYYVVGTVATNTFFISATSGGSVITTSEASDGTVTYVKVSDDEEEASLMAELSWAGIDPSKTHWVSLGLRNDLFKEGDGAAVTTGGQSFKEAIGNGDYSGTVTFATAHASADWHFTGLVIRNTSADSDKYNLFATITARSATQFSYQLNGTTNSGNYYIEGSTAMD